MFLLLTINASLEIKFINLIKTPLFLILAQLKVRIMEHSSSWLNFTRNMGLAKILNLLNILLPKKVLSSFSCTEKI